MKSKWLYKTRVILLLTFSLLCIILLYYFFMHQTILLFKENKALKEKRLALVEAPSKFKHFQNQLIALDSQIGYISSKNELSQDKILELIETFCINHNCYLKEYSKTIINTDKAFNLETNKIEVEGTYLDLLNLIYELEYNKKISKVSSSCFKKQIDMLRKKKD
jgi:hypothetical protein